MRNYVTPKVDIEVFDAYSDVILTSGDFSDVGKDDAVDDPF